MPVRDFRDLIVWQKSIDFGAMIYKLTRDFPPEERFGITRQVRDAAVSVSSNIAEGNGRSSTKDYLRFLSTSKGSLNEVRSLLVLAVRIECIAASRTASAEALMQEISKMLTTLMARLRKRVKRAKKGATSRKR